MMASTQSDGEVPGVDNIETGSEEKELCLQSHSTLEIESHIQPEVGPAPEARGCASDHFYDRITTMIPDEDLKKILRHQKHA